jgi:hypothetical protein
MLASRSHVRGFRRSVVHVVAAFAPVAGCDLLDQTRVIRNPPACDSSEPDGCFPPAEICPEELPKPGAECTTEGQSCDYDTGNTSETRTVCQGGRWTFHAVTVNPPAYDPCPTTLPQDDAPCHVSPDEECYFDGACGPQTYYAFCNGGRWAVAPLSCNPPECGVDTDCACPEDAPPAGNPCDLPADTVCTYLYCDEFPTQSATCVDGFWEITYTSCNPPPPECGVDIDCECPEEPPVSGGLCQLPTSEPCYYGDCFGGPTIDAQCVNGLWEVGHISCNPPPSEE